MARLKRVDAEDREEVSFTLRLLPYHAVSCDELPGIRGIGESPALALANMRAEIRRRYPFAKYDIAEQLVPVPWNPQP